NEFARKRIHPISVEAYHELGCSGRISEKTELLEGVIVEKTPKDPIHSSLVGTIFEQILKLLASKFMLRQENPLTLSLSEPEPDIAVVDFEKNRYIDHHPNF